MTPVKTWFLLLLSVLFIAPTVSEVMQSMKKCGGFLLLDKTPEVPDVLENGRIKGKNRYKVICQTYNNVRRFVTLYDTKNRIPVLSAYKFTGAEEGRLDDTWKMEPQLEISTNGKNMEDSDNTHPYKNQAGNVDYINSRYDRGHLLPSSYAKHDDDKTSTFTLTNVVPQVPSFNQGSWRRMEADVKRVMKRSCINDNGDIEGYIMTGATPSVSNKINNRVNVPSLLWSAFCCYSQNLGRWIAGAYWKKNINDTTPVQILNIQPLEQLYNKLNTKGKEFKAFRGLNCPLNEAFVNTTYSQPARVQTSDL